MGIVTLLALATFAAPRPTLTFQSQELTARFGVPFRSAVSNLLDVNTVPSDRKVYNAAGLMQGASFVRAGGGYEQPWTRDASINSWNAASLLEPEVARDTLWSVTRLGDENLPIVQRDNQWWDKIIWIVGAWNHYRVTGDRQFLTTAYGVSERLLREMREQHYDKEFSLFQGPSFFNDGIAGYPAPPAEADDHGSSFVLDHPGTDRLMTLSTNCLYVGAYRAAAEMAKELHRPQAEWQTQAKNLKDAINRRFWMTERRTYAYLVHGDAPLRGKLDPSEEGSGLAFAALFDVADPARSRSILRKAHLEPFGITDVYPSFPRFSNEHPGRHNAIVWPMVQRMFARAAAKSRCSDVLERQVEDLARLAAGSGNRFFEIYNAQTGKVDGGWQNGHAWGSEPDQTWSATAYLSIIFNGVFGMRFEPSGLRFEPLVPKGWAGATLTDVTYRGATLNLRLKGEGAKVAAVRLDGKPVRIVPVSLTGRHSVEIDVR